MFLMLFRSVCIEKRSFSNQAKYYAFYKLVQYILKKLHPVSCPNHEMSVIRIFIYKINFYDKNTCLGKEIIK